MSKIAPDILVIEPDEKFRELYSKFFSEFLPAKVTFLENTKNLQSVLRKENFKIVITEMYTKDMDGLDIIRLVKKEHSSISIIVSTGFATVENAVQALKNGAEHYFRKPFNFDEFKLTIKKELERERIFSGDVADFFSVFQTCQTISTCLDEKKIFEQISTFLKKQFSTQEVGVFDITKKSILQLYPEKRVIDIREVSDQMLKVISKKETIIKNKNFIALKFKCVGDSFKLAIVLHPKKNEINETLISKFKMLEAQILVAGKNIEHYSEVKHLAYVDDVTGLYNTRYLGYVLDKKIEEAKKLKESFAVLFIDMDHFKNINDSFGHLIGSKLLFEVGEQIKKCLREDDVTFRYGGDEFVAIVSNTSLEMAKTIAQRIRFAIEKKHFLAREGLGVRLTVSIGVAVYPEHAKNKKAILKAADAAMYEVKKTTRNNVFIFKEGKKGKMEATFEKDKTSRK